MAYVKVPVKVKEKKEANKKPSKAAARRENAANVGAPEDLPNELSEPRWSVVTFQRCAASSLTYNEAVRELDKLRAEKVAGLCIVTDEAAERIENKS